MPGGINPPESVILSWPKPNYADPQLRPPVVLVLAIILSIFLLIVSGVRLWVRWKIQKSIGLDDICYAAAVPIIFALTVVVTVATETQGYNKHIWDTPTQDNVGRRKYALAIMVLFSASSGLLKISVLLFCRRLSQNAVSYAFTWTLWIVIGSIAASTTVCMLKPLFACQPIAAFWDRVNYEKLMAGYTYTCFDEGADVIANCAISAFHDLLTALIPNILFWRVRMRLSQKVKMLALFSLAYCIAGLGFIRIIFNYRVYYETYDDTWHAWTSFLITMLELNLAALCACAPSLKAFITHYEIFRSHRTKDTTSPSEAQLKFSIKMPRLEHHDDVHLYDHVELATFKRSENGEDSCDVAYHTHSSPDLWNVPPVYYKT